MDSLRIDSHKLDLHPARVAQWLEADTWEKAKKVYPIYWEVTTAGACNHRCTFCSVDAIGYEPITVNRLALRDSFFKAAALGVKSVMFAGTGEPLLHKAINSIVQDASDAKLDSAFTTNGVLLHKLENIAKCSWVKISMNAGTAESYASIHRTRVKDWYDIWESIPYIVARKGSCKLGIQAVVLPENYKDMGTLAQLARDAGIDYMVMKPYSQATFSIVQRKVDYSAMQRVLEGIAPLYDTDKFKVIYRGNAMQQESSEHQYAKCNATPMFWVYSMANGDVFSCSAHLLDERFKIGNFTVNSFHDIWEGEKRRQNWEMMRSFDIKHCRKNCRMNNANIYLNRFTAQEHRNFI